MQELRRLLAERSDIPVDALEIVNLPSVEGRDPAPTTPLSEIPFSKPTHSLICKHQRDVDLPADAEEPGAVGLLGSRTADFAAHFFAEAGIDPDTVRDLTPPSRTRHNPMGIRREDLMALLDTAIFGDAFTAAFEDLYGPLHPRFVNCPLPEALQQARREVKYTMVYLHSSAHDNTPAFCGGVLACEPVVELLNESFLVWAGDIEHCDAEGLATLLGVTDSPFVAVLLNVEGDMAILDVMQGAIQIDEFMGRIYQIRDQYDETLQRVRQRTHRAMQEQMLRDDQEREYREALARDQQREESARIAAQAAEAEALAESERTARETQERLDREALAQQRRSSLLAALPAEPGAKDAGVVTVAVKISDGRRLVRRWSNTATLQAVFEFVEASAELSQNSFSLISQYPRCVYTPLDQRQHLTLSQLGFSGQVMLLVEHAPS
eukprot:TRINITY_DN6587_c0_g1_i1.p1 TRINITY_DN6587_c0_g1~~TRINITY_DN6587_c0_g1_i1.p1  ORF type:complete len:476 (-),score=118.02 TRINITY_DN6587_c0_g1_i1:14-1324(-)